jgi:hypothetical protein
MIGKAGGPDPALVVSIVAAGFAGLAVVFTAWGAWASHRSARSAERSARSAESSADSAAQAVELERDRRHRELTPRIELTYAGPPGDDMEGVTVANSGPLDYTSIAFNISPLEVGPIDSLDLGDGRMVRDGNIGPLSVGESMFLTLQRPPEPALAAKQGGVARLRITCRNEQGIWTIPAQVEIPGIPPQPEIWGF